MVNSIVLVADSGPPRQPSLAEALAAADFAVVAAAPADDLLALARAQQPHVIVLRVGALDARAQTLLSSLKADPLLAALPRLLVAREPDAAPDGTVDGWAPDPADDRVLVAWVSALDRLGRSEAARLQAEAARHQLEDDHGRAEQRLRQLAVAVDQSPTTIAVTDKVGRVTYVNRRFTEITGYTPGEVMGQNLRILKSGEQPPEFYKDMWETIASGREWRGEFHNLRKDGQPYWELAVIAPVRDALGQITHFVSVKEDVTTQRRLEREREALVTELQDALAHVRTLTGLLPICAHCKKIRDDRGYWKQIEQYISEHSEAQFSHGLCPECLPNYFPQKEASPAAKPSGAKPT